MINWKNRVPEMCKSNEINIKSVNKFGITNWNIGKNWKGLET